MDLFSETWQYLLDADNWTGAEGLVARLLEQLLLTATALAAAMLLGLPLALWLGHLGKGGFLAVNISNVGRAVPTFALLAILVAADWPGSAEFGPYGRAGLATLIALVLFALPPLITNGYVGMREVPSDVQEAADGMGMSSGHRHHCGAGRRAGARPHHHRGVRPQRLPPGHGRRCGRRRRRPGARARRRRRPAGRRPDATRSVIGS